MCISDLYDFQPLERAEVIRAESLLCQPERGNVTPLAEPAEADALNMEFA